MSKNRDEIIKKARIYTNMAYLLADVCNTFVGEVESEISKIGQELKYGEKKEFSRMLKEAKDLRARTLKIAAPIYGLKQVDEACEDSDWLYDYLKLLIDQTGDSDEKMKKVKAMLHDLTSELNIYDNE